MGQVGGLHKGSYLIRFMETILLISLCIPWIHALKRHFSIYATSRFVILSRLQARWFTPLRMTKCSR